MPNKSILLVEDEGPKRKHIEEYLNKYTLRPVNFMRAESVSSALELLETEQPDFIILDMSLPTYDITDKDAGGRPQGFGGIEVLRHMKMADNTTPTIVVTGYEAFMREEGLVELSTIASELERDFQPFFKGILYYNSTYSEWKSNILELLTKLDVV